MIEETYNKLGLSAEQIQQKRQSLVSQAKLQCGVNAIVERFEGPTKPLEGLKAKEGC